MNEANRGRRIVDSPEELRRFSNIGHIVEGTLIGISSALALGAALQDRQEIDPWPGVTAATGLLLSGGLVAVSGHHGGPARLFREDPQQRQHFVMGNLITTGALAEFASRRSV